MKKRLEEAIDRKISKVQPGRTSKVSPQVADWLQRNPGFQQAVVAKVTIQLQPKVTHGTKIGR